MNYCSPLAQRRAALPQASVLVLVGVLFVLSGCKQGRPEVDDPQLKPIQTILDEKLPIGTTSGAVIEFMSSRGYPLEPSDQSDTLIATIRHIDTEKMQPVTARITFHFDANGKLTTYEITRTMNAPIPQ